MTLTQNLFKARHLGTARLVEEESEVSRLRSVLNNRSLVSMQKQVFRSWVYSAFEELCAREEKRNP